ncbi:Uncharacterized protein FKW44_014448, partial [Caligus rogercresseyi]
MYEEEEPSDRPPDELIPLISSPSVERHTGSAKEDGNASQEKATKCNTETSLSKTYSRVVSSKSNKKLQEERINMNDVFKWETFVMNIEDCNGKAFRQVGLKHFDMYKLALFFGFKEHEIAGANPRLGLGLACFYTKFPVDVRDRLNELKKEKKIELRNGEGIDEEVTIKLKGIDKITVDRKKRLSLTAINTFKRINESKFVEWMQQFGEVVAHYPKKNPVDKEAEVFFPKYKNDWRDGDYIMELIADPSMIPQIVVFQGNIIKLRFAGARMQCQNCFNFGHLKHYCTHKKVRLFEYERSLRSFMSGGLTSGELPKNSDKSDVTIPPNGKESTAEDNALPMEPETVIQGLDCTPEVEVLSVSQQRKTTTLGNGDQVINEEPEDIGLPSEPNTVTEATEKSTENQNCEVSSEGDASEGPNEETTRLEVSVRQPLETELATNSKLPERPRKSHLDISKVLTSRTRSQSTGKRERSVSH